MSILPTKGNMAPSPRRWFTASGAERLMQSSPVSYEEYTRRARERAALPESFDEDAAQIQLDLDRIAPSLQQYLHLEGDAERDDGAAVSDPRYQTLVDKLRNILLAYSVRNARVGYVQGHADLLSFVLAHTIPEEDENQAFWIYATVLERVFPEDFFARSPKLHGFHVDVEVFEEMIAKRLVPHIPQLGHIDLNFLSSLLGCKWFVPVWVGELPEPLLVDLWDVMLCDEDGTFVHLLVALHFVRTACDALSAKLNGPWDASVVYSEVLTACRNLQPSIRLHDIRDHAQATYSLSDEGVEDWRANIRSQPLILAGEVRALMQTVHFQPSELIRLHGEFMFARTYLKSCERQHLRGLRREFVDGLLAREFPMLSSDFSRRCVDLLKRDAYGNISFFRVMQLLSILLRGSEEERAMLLFSVADRHHLLALDDEGIRLLGDVLTSLAIHQSVFSAIDDRIPGNDQMGHPVHRSPLLQSHFRALLEPLRDDPAADYLTHHSWLRGALACSDIRETISWNSTRPPFKRARSFSAANRTLPRTSNSSPTTANVLCLRKERERSASMAGRNKHQVVSTDARLSAVVGDQLPNNRQEVVIFSILNARMRKKYQRTYIQASGKRKDTDKSLVVGLDADCSPGRVFWCECVIS